MNVLASGMRRGRLIQGANEPLLVSHVKPGGGAAMQGLALLRVTWDTAGVTSGRGDAEKRCAAADGQAPQRSRHAGAGLLA